MKNRWMMMVGLPLVGLLTACAPEPTVVQVQPDVRPRVRVCALQEGIAFEEAVVVQGSIRTKFTAAVASRLPGTVDQLLVDEGDVVKQGQPLFQVDRVNLENRVAIAKDDQSVAAAAREEAVAAFEEATATYDKAATDEARYARLFTGSGSVTKDVWERAQLQLRSAAAAVARAKAAIATADAKILQAATALRIAEKDLADSQGCAPFDGVITKKCRDAGDYAGAGDAVLEMENPRVREACFMLNADVYGKVKVGETQVQTSFGQTLTVTYRAPTVNPVSRTFEIRAVMEADPTLAPGMLCEGKVVFESRTASGVPSSAVALREGVQTVYVVNAAGVVEAVAVQKGATAQGLTEIKDAAALKGAAIVREGMLLLNPGDVVKPVQ